MDSEHQQFQGRVIYHLYLNLHGPDEIYRALYEYLESVGAQRVGSDYPELWYFWGRSDDREKYQREIFAAVNSGVPQDILKHPGVAWRVLIMSPSGHNGCSGGFIPVVGKTAE